jgi:hypothetical protein
MIAVTAFALKIETKQEEDGGASPRFDDIQSRISYRPDGIVLENDGIYHHWMLPGFTYDMAHDGTGWRVTCVTWPSDRSSHVYRLSRGGRQFVTALPTVDGSVELDPATTYTVTQVAGAWSLVAA